MKYKQALNALWEMIGEDVRISVVVEGRVTVASFGARLLPPPPVPKLPWSRAKTLPAVEGPKDSAITIYDEWFVGAEKVYDGLGVRIDLKDNISLIVVRSPDYTPILEEAHALEAKRRST